ncbi:MAG: hypothetical protein RL215_1156 [Planctomycetota bacterium]
MTLVTDLESHLEPADAESIFGALEAVLIEQRDFHRLFDAKMMRVRRGMGLSVVRPTSLTDIPKEQEPAFRRAWTDTAREIGERFLEQGQLADAWAYFRTIQEPERVRAAIEVRVGSAGQLQDQDREELLNLALYDGAHMVEGIRLLLRTHGTCNTVTAMSQVIAQMTPAERRQAAAILVRHLYTDLQSSVRRDIERRQPLLRPEIGLRELIAGREFLFAEGNYHIDVSHLHSIVGFARNLHRGDSELKLAVELSLYGEQLAEHLRYPADVPFDDYYVASSYFLRALSGEDEQGGLDWFGAKLEREPDEADRRMIAFVLIDLATRLGRTAQVLERIAPWLSRMEDPNGFSFTAACIESGRADLLERAARTNDDVLAFATSLLARC